MNLYKLTPKEGLESDPWTPWYDKSFGFVIRAEDELQARRLAASRAGDEKIDCKQGNPWLFAKYSDCELLTHEGDQEIVLMDFASA